MGCKAASSRCAGVCVSIVAVLLIASGEKDIYFNRIFYQAAGEPKELWELPEGQHGAAVLQNSEAYVRRVVEFFDKTLL